MGPDIHHRGHSASTPRQPKSLYTFLLKVRYYKPLYDPEESAIRFIAYINEWRFIEVVVTSSWTDLRTMFGLFAPSEVQSNEAKWYKVFFRTLLRGNLNILDKNNEVYKAAKESGRLS